MNAIEYSENQARLNRFTSFIGILTIIILFLFTFKIGWEIGSILNYHLNKENQFDNDLFYLQYDCVKNGYGQFTNINGKIEFMLFLKEDDKIIRMSPYFPTIQMNKKVDEDI